MDIGDYVVDVRSGAKYRITAVHDFADYPSLLNFNMKSLDGLWSSGGVEGRFLVRCAIDENELLPPLPLGLHVTFNHQRYEVLEVTSDRRYRLRRVNAETSDAEALVCAFREELWAYPAVPTAH